MGKETEQTFFQRRHKNGQQVHAKVLNITNHQEMEIKTIMRASLVVQWLRICLLMQRTRVRALVWEDPTCHGATRPVSHNC